MQYHQIYKSPIGTLHLVASDVGLRAIHLLKSEVSNVEEHPNRFTLEAAEQLTTYFNNKNTTFKVALDWDGHSEFYKSVWTYLIAIPSGQTRSYLDIAKHLEKPGASRAVGLANGKNPIPIIVPCHRVIGSDGSLTGFALGLDIKKQLLMLENPKTFAIQKELF